jgi:Selenocysteine-specific translation elongation factor
VQRAVIALTKSDLGRIDVVTNQIREQLTGTPFADRRLFPLPSGQERALKSWQITLASQLARTEPQRDIRKPRLFIDRVFTLRGIGTVVTGTLTADPLRRGQQIVVYPTISKHVFVRFRAMGTNWKSRSRECDRHQSTDLRVDQIKRGDVVTLP